MIPRSLRFLRPARFLAQVLCLSALTASADVKVHGLFTDNLVLQRGVPVPIWGWADEGELVTVEFRGEKESAKCQGGKWSVRLGKLKAGGPDTLTISGKNSITLKNVLVGEVWIASGQSNMEWPLRASFDPRAEIGLAGNLRLRLYTVPKLKANEPVKNVEAAWEQCSPK